MSRFQAAYNNLTRYGPLSKIAKGYKSAAVRPDVQRPRETHGQQIIAKPTVLPSKTLG